MEKLLNLLHIYEFVGLMIPKHFDNYVYYLIISRMACLLDQGSSLPPTILTELITTTQAILGYETGEGTQFYAKPGAEVGVVILISKNRKLMEQKLLNLRVLQDNHCQVFNLCEKCRNELVNTFNKKLSRKYIHHYELLYSCNRCVLITHLYTNEVVRSCMEQLNCFKHERITRGPSTVIINLRAVEHMVLSEGISTYTSDTLDAYKDNSFCLAVRNLLKYSGASVVYVDSCEVNSDLEGVKEESGLIHKMCEEMGLLVPGGESKMKFQKLHSKLRDLVNQQTQNLYQIPLKSCEGRYSQEVILSSLILLILRTNKHQDTNRIVLYLSHKLKELVVRSLHILYVLECIHSSIEIVVSTAHNVTNSDLTAVLEARRGYFHETLMEREISGGEICLIEKAGLLCDCTTKLELLSQPANHELKLISTDKIGTHSSMFVLYNYARITQILNKFQQLTSSGEYDILPHLSETDLNLLQLPTEWSILVRYIISFPDLLNDSSDIIQHKSISKICQFLISLSQDFSNYYSKIKILQSGTHLQPKLFARIHFISSLKRVMEICFLIFDIKPTHQL